MAGKSTAVAVIPKVPLDEAALILAQLCDAIDNGAEIDALLAAQFADAKLDVANAVDRRIFFFQKIEEELEAARARRASYQKVVAMWDAKVQQLKALEDRVWRATKEIVEASPDLPYQGQYGKLAIQKNGGVLPLTTDFEALDADTISLFGIEPRFYRTTYSLDNPAIRAALEAGEDLPWARLGARGTQLKIKPVPGAAS